jgi:hypothetical protein
MRKRARTTTIAIVVAVVLAVVGLAFAAPGPHAASAKKPHLVLKGHVTNLWPGATRAMSVSVKSPYPYKVAVRSIRMKVRGGKGPLGTCPASAIAIKKWRGKLTIKPRGSKRVVLVVTMKQNAPNSCQGALLPVTFSAVGVRA